MRQDHRTNVNLIFTRKMRQPIRTVGLCKTTIANLRKKGLLCFEDLINNPEHLQKSSLEPQTKKLLQSYEKMALDVWQIEPQKESISTCCSDLDHIFENSMQCGVITELRGAPFSGKTQICMQLCLSVQLNKHHGGLDGRAIYIDTRSGISALRFSDFVRGCNKHYKDLDLNENDAFENIQVLSPKSLDDFSAIIEGLRKEIKRIRNEKKVRLIIIDSLSMPILCTIDDPSKRPYYYSENLCKLHQYSLKHDIAVVITNEWITQGGEDGKAYCTAAGGQHVSDYSHIILESTSLGNNEFAIRLIKSPVTPQISVTFMINEDGIRKCTSRKRGQLTEDTGKVVM